MKKRKGICLVLLLIFSLTCTYSQKSGAGKQSTSSKSRMADSTFTGLMFRGIGPALMSGRIADIAIDPTDENIRYVAAGSGGVWKTVNAGVTWTSIFDGQKSFSIGCVTIDANNPNTIWVGTGENVGGRHVGFGDGVYRSDDGGANWKNMGLSSTEHISKIIVHPKNSNIVWVAAQGPLWTKGGERGLFKTIDGGKTWKQTLGDSVWVGVTDIAIDPRNPDLMYAATWQRHRTVAAYMGGGPGSGIHRSTDGGLTWTKLASGLPTSNPGKIGIAISPQQPDVVYAAIELDRKTGGVFRSADRGQTWEKKSSAVAGATGPHYYQEIYASPHQFDRIYLMDNLIQISEDGGKTFTTMNTEFKHVDNHVIAFKKNDPNYLLVGTDGGVYESFDLAKNWRYAPNLPLTQFYKLAVDESKPFYKIYGGTQDNSTLGGPSRTDNFQGIQNSDWKIVLNWDGYQPATEPGNPDIVYAQRQEGTLSRIDISTGDVTDIQPQPDTSENAERFNWDAPILVSPFLSTRIYFASQRVWKSDNRGDKWTAISGDLTKNQERITLPIMGKVQSWNEAWDINAMSNYNTITSLSESPKQAGLIYAGTDDGLIQVTEDGGANWRKIEVGSISGVPATSFVNDIKADLFDANTVYVALDNHKSGDFSPYLVRSTDRGRTWKAIQNNIPSKSIVWRIVQDHVKKELLFAATESGIYFTINSGNTWIKLKGGLPTISFRDLAIQKSENDLVGASFGRGFFVFDDYRVLREISEQQLDSEATLFSTRKALWYIPRSDLGFEEPKGTMGASHYIAPNPAFGAVFTYYLKDGLITKSALRTEREKELRKGDKDIPNPGWDTLNIERNQDSLRIWITVKDAGGNVVRRIQGPVSGGFHRINWDLKFPAPDAILLNQPTGNNEYVPVGLLAAPGTYTASLSKQIDGVITELSAPITFTVEQLRKGAIAGSNPEAAATFWRKYEEDVRATSAVQITLNNSFAKVVAMQKALEKSKVAPGTLDQQLYQVRQSLLALDMQLNGDPSKNQIGEKSKPTIPGRLFTLNIGISNSTYGPTATHLKTVEIIEAELKNLQIKLNENTAKLTAIGTALIAAGAPWVEGEALPMIK